MMDIPEKFVDPKGIAGAKKPGVSCLPMTVVFELGAAMAEGACKYGPFNWRYGAPVVAESYYNATMRHLTAWWEGEDIDPDSGLSHITKAISSLVVLRDAMLQNQLEDDRPPSSGSGWQETIQAQIEKNKPEQ